MPPVRKAWTRDELLVVLNLYHKLTFGQLHSRNPAIIALAEKLGRGANSVAMKLCNFASLDPVQQMRGIKGLQGASSLDRTVWNEFHENPAEAVPASEESLQALFDADDGSEVEDSTEGCLQENFDRMVAWLSVRARNFLFIADVRDPDGLLRLTYEEILAHRNCGKKTAAEIIALQEALRPCPKEPPPAPLGPTIAYGAASSDILDAIRGRLSVRANHTLDDLAVDSLSEFMALDEDRLLARRYCGKGTTSQILRLQASLASFAKDLVKRDGSLDLDALSEAPCLRGAADYQPTKTPAAGPLIDVENPASWLADWVGEIAPNDRHTRVFRLRMGMLGSPPVTLEAVAREFGLTRERVRQMQKKVAEKAAVPSQQRRLQPLVAECARIVAQHGGVIDLAELTEAVLYRGEGADQLRHATAFMAFLASLKVWQRARLRAPRNGVVSDHCHPLPAAPVAPIRKPRAKGRTLRHAPFPTFTQAQLDLGLDFDPDDLTI